MTDNFEIALMVGEAGKWCILVDVHSYVQAFKHIRASTYGSCGQRGQPAYLQTWLLRILPSSTLASHTEGGETPNRAWNVLRGAGVPAAAKA